MSIGALVFARLAAAGAVTALVGSAPARIFPNVIPQSSTLPSCAYAVVHSANLNSLLGHTSGTENARVQVDCYARTYSEADALAQAIVDTLKSVQTSSFSSVQVSRRDLYEDETELHRVSVEFSIWSQP